MYQNKIIYFDIAENTEIIPSNFFFFNTPISPFFVQSVKTFARLYDENYD
jgi:hypothetical protein